LKRDRIIQTKQELRERIIKLLKSQKEEERLTKSLIIQRKLFYMPEFKKACVVLFYASFNGEVDTFSMMEQALCINKKIALPRLNTENKDLIPTQIKALGDLEVGSYGIKQPTKGEPVALEAVDMVVVPGLAFDKNHYRLGRGGGHYDRFLKTLPSRIPTVGLAFDFQIVDTLPQIEEHDVPVTHVLVN